MPHYRGGPCDGQSTRGSIYGELYCGGVKYVLGEDLDYHALTAIPTLPGIPGERQVGQAWHRLTRTLAVQAPHAIRRVRAARTRIRRAVR
jgi:hypothetical protein